MSESFQKDFDSKYCYMNSNVLINKLNIKDADELYDAERYITKARNADLMVKPIKGTFDLKHLKDIHRYLFHDIYNWAGKIRTVNIAKGELFCLPEFIPDMSEGIFSRLEKDKFLIGLPSDEICEKLAYYTGEINAMHPFREGNGRTQREFIRELGAVAGFEVNFSNISGQEMITASIDSFNKDYTSMIQIFQKSTREIGVDEHKKVANLMVSRNSKAEKMLGEYFEQVPEIQKELKDASFKPDQKVVRNIWLLNQQSGKKHSLAEIKKMYKEKDRLPKESKEIICEVADALKKQELARGKNRTYLAER